MPLSPKRSEALISGQVGPISLWANIQKHPLNQTPGALFKASYPLQITGEEHRIVFEEEVKRAICIRILYFLAGDALKSVFEEITDAFAWQLLRAQPPQIAAQSRSERIELLAQKEAHWQPFEIELEDEAN